MTATLTPQTKQEEKAEAFSPAVSRGWRRVIPRIFGEFSLVVTDPGLDTAVLCGHGEQIGGLVRQLAEGGLLVEEPLRWAKGATTSRSRPMR